MALFAIAYTIVTVFAPTPIPLLLTFTLVLILFGIITWQRYVSKAHTAAELLAGFVSGFISVGLMLFYIDTFGY
jgi:general stress protein CsbA